MPRILILLIALPFVLILNTAHSQNEGWQIFRADEDYIYYIKPNTIIQTPQKTYKVWIKEIVAETNKIELNKKVWWKYDYLLELTEYDCAQRRTLLLQIVGYDSKGSPVDNSSYYNKEGEKNWRDVIPGTRGEAILEKVCAECKKAIRSQ